MTPQRKTKAIDWPKKLSEIREVYKLSQAEAAAKINGPLGTWRNWEQGRREPNPMIQRLLELSFPNAFKRKS